MDKSIKITNGGFNYQPIFNNDGRKIAYHYMKDYDMGHEIRVITDELGGWGI